jgi:type III restriction enzyme
MLTSEAVRNSIYPRVPFDSKVEQTFAKALDRMHETFRIFAKLPRTFSVPTPLGRYEPDWAIVKHETESVYLIRETKSTRDYEKLRTSEALKVRCGKKHFEALDVSFKVVDSVEQV